MCWGRQLHTLGQSLAVSLGVKGWKLWEGKAASTRQTYAQPCRVSPTTCSLRMAEPIAWGSCVSAVRVHGCMPATAWRPTSSSRSQARGRFSRERGT